MAGFALPLIRQVVRREIVETVPGLVNQCVDIIGNADGVHKDEGPTTEREIGAIAPRRLPCPTLKVQQFLRRHDVELPAEFWIDAFENALRLRDKRLHIRKRAQRFRDVQIDRDIPRSQRVYAEHVAAMPHQPLDGRRDGADHGVVKARAIVRRVVEPMFRGETVALKIGETRFTRDRGAKRVHLVELVGQRVAVLEIG